MNPPGCPNPVVCRIVMPGMEPIQEAHVREPGQLVVDVAAADDATALKFQEALAGMWATSTAQRTTRDAGQPGVRLRCNLDLRQPIGSQAEPGASTGA
jgi:hypothetical protein